MRSFPRSLVLLVPLLVPLACRHGERKLAPPVDTPVVVAKPAPTPVPPVLPSEPPPSKPSPPPEPPYDLQADLDARRDELRAEIGKSVRFEVVEGVFLIASPSGAVGSSAVVSKAAIEAYFNGRFSKRPERAVTVLLFDKAAPYDKWCATRWGKPCFTPFGFYSSDVRTVVMNVGPGIGTLTHELVHPIVEADFPQAPDWINEGIASLYEAFSMPKKGEIVGNKNFRHPALLAAVRSKDGRAWANLPKLFGMSDKTFRGDNEGLNYAMARYFCQWMDAQKKLWPFYRAWRDGFADDATGEKAFRATTGKTPSEADPAWAAWVQAL